MIDLTKVTEKNQGPVAAERTGHSVPSWTTSRLVSIWTSLADAMP